MMSDDQILEVVQAHKEGKKIQFSFNGCPNIWNDAPEPEWNFQLRSYRVAIEPRKPREWAVYVTNEGRIIQDARSPQEHLEFPYIRVREVIE